jgi:hypothetical protein
MVEVTSPPPAEPNHLYVVLPSATVDEIGMSAEVADRFTVETATTDAGNESWTGTYLLGADAYLELFTPDGMEGRTEGSIGLGFSSARVGDAPAFQKRLEVLAPGRAVTRLRTRKIGDHQEPWFHLLTLDTLQSGPVSAWLMDFHPEDLMRRGLPAGPGEPFERAAYLPDPKEGGAADLLELRLDLTDRELGDLAVFLHALGLESAPSPGGRVFDRPGFRVTTTINDLGGRRIESAAFSLSSPADSPTEVGFGASVRLHLSGDRAEWRFR